MEATDKIERIDQESLASLEEFTLPQILSRQAEKFKDEKVAIREKSYGIWHNYTWKDYLRYTKLVALGLVSLGLKRGENVGMIVDNDPEWLFAQLGAQSVGAVTLTLFTSAVAKELAGGLGRVRATYVFACPGHLCLCSGSGTGGQAPRRERSAPVYPAYHLY